MRDFCSLPVLAYRCQTVSSSAHWKLVFLNCFLALKCASNVAHFSEVFCKCSTNALFCLRESGVRDNGKPFVEWLRAKETMNGGSQMYFTAELL